MWTPLLLSSLSLAAVASAAPLYTVTSMGVIGTFSGGVAISSAGTVAGTRQVAGGPLEAFVHDHVLTPPHGTMAQAAGINRTGIVVGTAHGQRGPQAVTWDQGEARAVTEDASYGLAINDEGNVAGQVIRGSRAQAFRTRDGMVEMPDQGSWSSAAYALNENGAVVGTAETGHDRFRAFLWDEAGDLHWLGTLGGRSSYGAALNMDGWVVGTAQTGQGDLHAFLSLNGIMTDLGTLGGSMSAAYGVNDREQIVGWSSTGQGLAPHAFLWQQGELRNLNDLVSAAAWVLTEATGINNRGQIVGTGWYQGERHAFRLDPLATSDEAAVPEPGTWLLLAAGLVLMAWRGQRLKSAARPAGPSPSSRAPAH